MTVVHTEEQWELLPEGVRTLGTQRRGVRRPGG
jgi:hypothetical protein